MIKDLYDKMKNMDTEIGQLKQENVKLKGKVDKLEEQSRRENLIFYGIPEITESEKETWEDCEKKVRTVMKVELRIEHALDEEIQIGRAHSIRAKKAICTKTCHRKVSQVENKGQDTKYW